MPCNSKDYPLVTRYLCIMYINFSPGLGLKQQSIAGATELKTKLALQLFEPHARIPRHSLSLSQSPSNSPHWWELEQQLKMLQSSTYQLLHPVKKGPNKCRMWQPFRNRILRVLQFLILLSLLNYRKLSRNTYWDKNIPYIVLYWHFHNSHQNHKRRQTYCFHLGNSHHQLMD